MVSLKIKFTFHNSDVEKKKEKITYKILKPANHHSASKAKPDLNLAKASSSHSNN
jgi:hypothetical protein